VTNLLAAGGGTNLDSLYSESLFWILAFLAVTAAVGMILVRQAVHCALLLAVVMLSLSALYAMQGAPFLAFVQVIVYTGAVLMLFLFVMMLIGSHSKDSLVETIKGQWFWGIIAGAGLATLLIVGIGHAAIGTAPKPSAAFGNDNLTGLAHLIFTTYVYPFEITSALLITAALGAMVLAHRERISPKLTQRDIAQQRVRSGHVMPEPPPGVYALHDATDIPALLPDGSTADRSVSAALVQRDISGVSGISGHQVSEVPGHEAAGHEIEAGSHGGEA
jgi:NADH-quinone oxidoreductase subunit J